MSLHSILIQDVVRQALQEDMGRGDLTTEATVDPETHARARLIAKAEGRLAGLPVALEAFKLLDDRLDFTLNRRDGEDISPGDHILTVRGNARAILSAERVALNFLQHLSGIATATAKAVAATQGTKARITDTRKTTPGLRKLEKYAVRMGGGVNHRFGLDDAVLIKENHIQVAGGIEAAVAKARARLGHMHKIEVEAETLDQVEEALQAGVDAILLDNMDDDTTREAVDMIGGRAISEASGGITLERIPRVAQTGVDIISVGWITHSVQALDMSLLIDA